MVPASSASLYQQDDQNNIDVFIQKRFHNRETIAALNYKIQKMSYILPFYATQMINPFPDSRISANND